MKAIEWMQEAEKSSLPENKSANIINPKVIGAALNIAGKNHSNKGLKYRLDRLLENISQGKFEKLLSAITSISASSVGTEVYFEHSRVNFAKRIMWFPVILSPFMVAAGIGGVVSKRFAKTLLPAISSISIATSFVGSYFHLRAIANRPGGWDLKSIKFKIETGPPLFAPMLFSLVGGMGILSAILRRED